MVSLDWCQTYPLGSKNKKKEIKEKEIKFKGGLDWTPHNPYHEAITRFVNCSTLLTLVSSIQGSLKFNKV